MAEKRMFAKTITESDAFLELSPVAQMLYIHLNMNADDWGVVNSSRKVLRISGATEEDMQALIDAKFVIPFPGVVVIKHWFLHNYIPKDRRTPSKYGEILDQLRLADNKAYTLGEGDCIQSVYSMYAEEHTQIRIDKNRLEKRKYSDPLPVYDDSKNPSLDQERLASLLERRNNERS